MPLNIVLVEPEIHTNTGNIGRLSLASNSNLHLVKPLGFELSDKRLKRAGLDYWKHISLFIYDDFDDFLNNSSVALFMALGDASKVVIVVLNMVVNAAIPMKIPAPLPRLPVYKLMSCLAKTLALELIFSSEWYITSAPNDIKQIPRKTVVT